MYPVRSRKTNVYCTYVCGHRKPMHAYVHTKTQPLSTRLCTWAIHIHTPSTRVSYLNRSLHTYTYVSTCALWQWKVLRWPYSPNPTPITFCSHNPKQAPMAFSYSSTMNTFTSMEVPESTDKTLRECIFYTCSRVNWVWRLLRHHVLGVLVPFHWNESVDARMTPLLPLLRTRERLPLLLPAVTVIVRRESAIVP